MKRRDFLRRLGLMTLGALAFPAAGMKLAAAQIAGENEKASLIEPPYIYRRFLTFTEYELRPRTDFLVIHHTGFPTDKDSSVTEIHDFHLHNNGWAGAGYHYFIQKDGTLEQGRRPMMVGAHAYGFNKESIGIALAGNFDIGRPTKEQIKTLKHLTAWLCQEYALDPTKKGTILGHRDLNETTCPGNALYDRLEEIRESCATQLTLKGR
ncbi:MAG: N-acetylmuramoyl-L-alanine amidase [Selenomonadaceae bacterium]|nr:N-acetylmuramoyl-L-alanine amidase [Selenomonadaceae bacterium]